MLRQTPAAATRPIALTPAPTLGAPERLPRRPSFVPASASIFRAGTGSGEPRNLQIDLHGLPASIAPEAGVAVFDAVMDVQLEWLPIAGLERSQGIVSLRTTAKAAPLRLALAASEASARNGWFSRLELPADRDEHAPVALPAAVQTVTVQLDAQSQNELHDLRLRRTDDPSWRPFAMGSHLQPDAKGVLVLTLGPGDYCLSTITGGLPQELRITVPGPSQLSAPAAATRDGRL
jgi:hypothetical protein